MSAEISSVISYAQRIDELPDVPFITLAVEAEVIKILAEIDINQEMEFSENEAGLYFRLRHGQPRHQIMIDTHLDHPGIALNKDGYGVCLGTFGEELLKGRLSEEGSERIRIFDRQGDPQGEGKITGFSHGKKPLVKFEPTVSREINNQGLWILSDDRPSEDYLAMRSADNDIVTAVALEQIRFTLGSGIDNIDITWFFSRVEEVHQVSATLCAVHGTPFGKIDQNTIILVLEAMEMTNYPWQIPLLRQFNLPSANPNAGLAIKVNDGEVPYGYQNDPDNLSENLLLQAAMSAGIKYQHTLTGGSTNAKSYSLEGSSPHVATLAIPCINKHNVGNKAFTHEIVRKSDIVSCLKVMEYLVKIISNEEIVISNESLTKTIRGMLTGRIDYEKLRRSRRAIMESVRPRLKAKKYFPETIGESIDFKISSLRARLMSLS